MSHDPHLDPSEKFAELVELIRSGRLRDQKGQRLPPLDSYALYDLSLVYEDLAVEVDPVVDSPGMYAEIVAFRPPEPLVAHWASIARGEGALTALCSIADAPAPDRFEIKQAPPQAKGVVVYRFGYVARRWHFSYAVVLPNGTRQAILVGNLPGARALDRVAKNALELMKFHVWVANRLGQREVDYVYDPQTPAHRKINDRRERALRLPPIASAKRILHLREKKRVHPQPAASPTGRKHVAAEERDYHKAVWSHKRSHSGFAHRRKELLDRPKTKQKPWYQVVP